MICSATAVEYAVEYLYETHALEGGRGSWDLTNEFAGNLSDSCHNLLRVFGKIKRKDVALLVEGWLLARRGGDFALPLVRLRTESDR